MFAILTFLLSLQWGELAGMKVPPGPILTSNKGEPPFPRATDCLLQGWCCLLAGVFMLHWRPVEARWPLHSEVFRVGLSFSNDWFWDWIHWNEDNLTWRLSCKDNDFSLQEAVLGKHPPGCVPGCCLWITSRLQCPLRPGKLIECVCCLAVWSSAAPEVHMVVCFYTQVVMLLDVFLCVDMRMCWSVSVHMHVCLYRSLFMCVADLSCACMWTHKQYEEKVLN